MSQPKIPTVRMTAWGVYDETQPAAFVNKLNKELRNQKMVLVRVSGENSYMFVNNNYRHPEKTYDLLEMKKKGNPRGRKSRIKQRGTIKICCIKAVEIIDGVTFGSNNK